MPSRLIVSPNYLLSPDSPVIFLAGPIQGADDWQKVAARIIEGNAPDLYVANPRREIITKGEFATTQYNEQVDWETHHLSLQGKMVLCFSGWQRNLNIDAIVLMLRRQGSSWQNGR